MTSGHNSFHSRYTVSWMKATYRLLWARLGIFMLLFLSGMAPLHLVAEVHSMLPASARHHAQIHCAPAGPPCNQPQDDVSKPLTGAEHERHHEVNCSNDGAFSWAQHLDMVSAAPTQWQITALDLVPFLMVWPIEFAVTTNGSRGPPPANETLPLSPYSSHFSGRAPPTQA